MHLHYGALHQRAVEPNDLVGNQEEDNSKTVRVAAVDIDRHASVKGNQLRRKRLLPPKRWRGMTVEVAQLALGLLYPV
jgi:hypothetical protein